jgi:hypothetical protein
MKIEEMETDEIGRIIGAWYVVNAPWGDQQWDNVTYAQAVNIDSSYLRYHGCVGWKTKSGEILSAHKAHFGPNQTIFTLDHIPAEPLPKLPCTECWQDKFLGNDYMCLECREAQRQNYTHQTMAGDS